jgi:hypothetical protein
VPMIHAAIIVAKAPEKYGFTVAPEPLLTFDTVPVEGAMDLRLIAECAGTPLQQIQTLNPELRRLATPAGRTFAVKVPTGVGATTAPPRKRPPLRPPTVPSGSATRSRPGTRWPRSPRATRRRSRGSRPGTVSPVPAWP